MDLTGRFPKCSSHSNEYILVRYHYDTNCILVSLIKNRKGSIIINIQQALHNTFKKSGVAPSTYVLDNEISKDLIDGFEQEKITYQLVTPYKHRNNQAERAIQTFKAHFKSTLVTVDPNFLLSEWYRLIPQANITLNLL